MPRVFFVAVRKNGYDSYNSLGADWLRARIFASFSLGIILRLHG